MPQQQGLSDAELEKLAGGSMPANGGLSDEELNDLEKKASSGPDMSGLEYAGDLLYRGAAGVGRGVYNTLTAPFQMADAAGSQGAETEVRPGGGLGILMNKMIIEPTEENARALWESVKAGKYANADNLSNALGMVPVVGPMAKDLFERARSGDVAGAITEGATYIAMPKLMEKGIKMAGERMPSKTGYGQERPLLFMRPEGHLQTALKPDLSPELLQVAGDQLKAGEAKIGKPVKDIDSALEAEKAQFEQELMPARRKIIDPQKGVTIPGSRRQLIKAKVEAIPADIRPGTPEYVRLVNDIKESIPVDLTLGELEDITTSLNQQNRGYHQAKLSSALSKMENANGAMNVAAEIAARQIMQDGMEKLGLGGADALREINQRIGALIRIRDAIFSAEKTARTEAALPRFRRLTKRGSTVNEGIAAAMRDWKTKSGPIDVKMRAPAPPSRQLAASNTNGIPIEGTAPDPSSVKGTGVPKGQFYTKLLGPAKTRIEGTAPDTSSVKGTGVGKGQFYTKLLRSGQEGVTDYEGVNSRTAENMPSRQAGSISAGPAPDTSYAAGFNTIARESLYNSAAKIPEGSKLMYRTKTSKGFDYHYETPDGRVVTSDMSPDMVRQYRSRPK